MPLPPPPGVITLRMATVGDPGNPSVGVISVFGGQQQFVEPPADGGIYADCSEAPPGPPNCITTGGVDYTYGIGELEITVDQYVTFLNTADPGGENERGLYHDYMNPTVWPKYGSVAYSPDAEPGEHYAVAYPEWADKPFGFANFLRAARFVNSLANGELLSQTESSDGGFNFVTYEVQLSPETESGMYDMSNPATKRTSDEGFVIDQPAEGGARTSRRTAECPRRQYLEALMRLLAVHETAQEIVVYPVIRAAGERGEAIAEASLAEEDAAKKELAKLERLDIGSTEFETQFGLIRSAVEAHAAREEQDVLPRLERAADDCRAAHDLQLRQTTSALKIAEGMAPTYAHAAAPESALGNVLVGPFVAIVDRVGDALRDAMR